MKKFFKQERSLELANFNLKVRGLSTENLILEGVSILNEFLDPDKSPTFFLNNNFEIVVNELYVRANNDDIFAATGISYLFTEILRNGILFDFYFVNTLRYISSLVFDKDNLQEAVQFEENLKLVVNYFHEDNMEGLLNAAGLKSNRFHSSVFNDFSEFSDDESCMDNKENFLNDPEPQKEEDDEDEFNWPYSDEEEVDEIINMDNSDDTWDDFEFSSDFNEEIEEDPWAFMNDDSEETECEEIVWNPVYDDEDEEDEEDDFKWA